MCKSTWCGGGGDSSVSVVVVEKWQRFFHSGPNAAALASRFLDDWQIDSLVNNGNVHLFALFVYYLLCFLKMNRTHCTGPNLIKTIIFRDSGLFGSCGVNNFWLSRDKTKAISSLKGLSGNNQWPILLTHIYHIRWRNRRNETKLNQKWSHMRAGRFWQMGLKCFCLIS